MVEVTLVGLEWDESAGHDIHLLPDLASPRFNQLLSARIQNPSGQDSIVPVIGLPGLTLTFSAKFNGAPGPSFGVTVDPNTGEVEVASLPAGPRLRSFLVTAAATLDADTVTTRIRVYVHEAIIRMWLTPETLTLRQAASNMRFSVLAEFDDGVIGDISNWSPLEPLASAQDFRHVHAVGVNTSLLSWSSARPPEVTADPDTGLLGAFVSAGTVLVTVGRGAQTASAVVRCAQTWWPLGVRVSRVVAPGTPADLVGPGVGGMLQVPNVLFLPDGFQETDKGVFERLVRDLVARLSTRNWIRPFGHLRINYFMTWVPSPDAGVSVLNELSFRPPPRVATVNGDDVVYPVELPSVHSSAGNWELEDLIHEVGLPTPFYDPLDRPIASRVSEWQAVYGQHITEQKVQHLYDEWLWRGTRRLANERDTAFHMTFGERPKLETLVPDMNLTPHPRRLFPHDVDLFINGLLGPNGEELPPVWTFAHLGKDSDLVVILCRSQHIGGRSISRADTSVRPFLGVSLNDVDYHRVRPNAGGDGFDPVPDPIPAEVNHHVWLTIARELAQSWTVGVEYGGDTSAPAAARLQEVNERANLQAHATLLDASNLLVADHIRWGRWPRIVKAGVLRAVLRPAGADRLVIPLDSNRRAGFVVGDIVRLRTRPLPASIGHSGRFQVIDVNSDDVTISPLPGTIADPATLAFLYPPREVVENDGVIPGSILMAPDRAPDPNPAAGQYGDDLMMMTDAVRQRINLTHNPLNARPLLGEAPPPNDPAGRACANVELSIPTAATNFPGRAAPDPPRFSPWVIGLYENGGTHNCGIYRPTGMCLMNTQLRPAPGQWLTMFEFCLVCRYALVDWINPARHRRVNADYRQRYEKKTRGGP